MDTTKQKLKELPSLYWVPGILVGVGITLSFFFWFVVLTDLKVYFDLLNKVKLVVPWLVLAFGVSLSLLVAFIARTAILERHHANIVEHINQHLIHEIQNKEHLIEYKEKMEKSLRQDQKLQAIGTLAGGVAHEFNNLLYAIVGYAEMAREDSDQMSATHKNLGKILEAAKRGQELISRILSFSRNQNPNQPFELMDVKKTLEATLSFLRPTTPASVSIHQKLADHLLINGNPNQLQQVLVNLVNNAVDAMDAVGDITIESKRIACDDPLLINIENKTTTDYCQISIHDTGSGMDQHSLDRIFEPFFTTKEVGKGTGLGLAIAHSIIDSHSGKIIVDSTFGRGTTFTIFLPMAEKTDQPN